jgi:glycosyltransferase involved in cell wall biosynthesis
MKNKKTLLLVVNVDWFFISHRLKIATKALKEGWRVIVAANDTGMSSNIENMGIEFVSIPLNRYSLNPISEIKTIHSLYKLYKKINPTIVHHITLKPIIYGSIIARILKVNRVINAISGLGYNFTNNKNGVVPKLMLYLLKIGMNNKRVVLIFQNKDDLRQLKKAGIVNENHTIHFIKGAGVDLEQFKFKPIVKKTKLIILFPARMLWNKGIKELLEVANLMEKEYKEKLCFELCGMLDNDSKDAVPEEYLMKWNKEGYITWKGHQNNMLNEYERCDIVVLPSYREGMPKSLMEACAVGRPIITTEAFGCKECVEEGKNGFKVPVKSVSALKEAIEILVNSEEKRIEMGLYSRRKAENEFSLQKVVDSHIKIYNNYLN